MLRCNAWNCLSRPGPQPQMKNVAEDDLRVHRLERETGIKPFVAPYVPTSINIGSQRCSG